MLLAGITPCINAVDFQRLVGGQRRNELALASLPVKSPAMVAAFNLLAVEPAMRKRHATMWARVMQSERPSLTIAANCQWSFEQHGFAKLPAGHLV